MEEKTNVGQIKPNDPRPVAAYTRVSTRVQFKDGYSIEAQKSVLTKAANLFAEGRKIVFFVDHCSGRTMARPEYQAMLGDLKRERFSMLLAFSTDRLSRNTGDFSRLVQVLEDKRVALYLHNLGITTLSPAGKLLLTMVSAIGEFESEQISQRTKASIEHLASMKKKGPGRRPFGWQVDDQGNLIDDANEQRLIMLANQFRGEGWSWAKIADYANRLKIPPAEAPKWCPAKIRGCVIAANNRFQAIADFEMQSAG